MALLRIIGIKFEQTDRVYVGMRRFRDVERRVEIGRIGGTIVSFNELKGVRSETIVRVEICRSRLIWVCTCVMSKRFLILVRHGSRRSLHVTTYLQSKLVYDSVALVLDVV